MRKKTLLAAVVAISVVCFAAPTVAAGHGPRSRGYQAPHRHHTHRHPGYYGPRSPHHRPGAGYYRGRHYDYRPPYHRRGGAPGWHYGYPPGNHFGFGSGGFGIYFRF